MKRRSLRRLHIPVTQEIINNATQRDSSHCVIADAVRAALPDVTRVTVDLQTIRFTLPGGERVIYLTPASEQALLVNFDQGQKPSPRDMYLSHPIQILPARDRSGESQKRTTVVKHKRRATENHGAQIEVTVEGGKLPPTAALSNTRGRRRTFGLRTLQP